MITLHFSKPPLCRETMRKEVTTQAHNLAGALNGEGEKGKANARHLQLG